MFDILSDYIDQLEEVRYKLDVEYLEKFCKLSFSNEELDQIQQKIHDVDVQLDLLWDLVGTLAGGAL